MGITLSSQQAQAEMLQMARLAPLSLSMVFHLLDETLNSPLLAQQLDHLTTTVTQVRKQVSALLTPMASERGVMVKSFQELFVQLAQQRIIQKETEKVFHASLPTVKSWRDAHLLRGASFGKLDPDSVAAVLIASQVDPKGRLQGFLPLDVGSHEPWWWCYGQLPPRMEGGRRIFSPVEIFPIPLPEHLPVGTLLWTPWTTFDPFWKCFGDVGAMRFVGATMSKEGVRWKVPFSVLQAWDPDLLALRRVVPDSWLTGYQLHLYGETTLLHLAYHYLFDA